MGTSAVSEGEKKGKGQVAKKRKLFYGKLKYPRVFKEQKRPNWFFPSKKTIFLLKVTLLPCPKNELALDLLYDMQVAFLHENRNENEFFLGEGKKPIFPHTGGQIIGCMQR